MRNSGSPHLIKKIIESNSGIAPFIPPTARTPYRFFVRVTYEKILVIFRARGIINLSKQRRLPKLSVKKFFRIENSYKFEWNDLRAFITVVNVILIMTYGLSISWFGLAVAIIGVIKDLTKDRRINGLMMHLANVALNVYFLCLLYLH